MTWDEVLSYETTVKSIARVWANKKDPSLYEDVVHYTYIAMVEKIDLSRAEGPELEYVKGAIWNIVKKFFQVNAGGSWDHVSLEQLKSDGVQIDEDGNPRWVGTDGEYKGGYRSDGKK